MIDLTKYQQAIKQFYTPEVEADLLTYSRELLVSEVGEVIGLRAKRRRGDARLQDDSAYRAAVIDEMGDVLWALASIATVFKYPLNSIVEMHYVPGIGLGLILKQVDLTQGGVNLDSYGIEITDLLSWLWSYAIREQYNTSITLGFIAARNIEKLQVRAANNLIRGSGHEEERA